MKIDNIKHRKVIFTGLNFEHNNSSLPSPSGLYYLVSPPPKPLHAVKNRGTVEFLTCISVNGSKGNPRIHVSKTVYACSRWSTPGIDTSMANG